MSTTAGQIIEAIELDLDFDYRIEQTGGGTATIFVGGDDQIAIGPGTYDWNDPYASEFNFGDLSVGLDGTDEYTLPDTMLDLVAAVEHYITG